MHKRANIEWAVPDRNNSYEAIQLIVLMDIRHQLQELNRKVDATRSCPTLLGTMIGIQEIGKDIRRRERAKRKQRKKQ
jgi:hypothetical protein